MNVTNVSGVIVRIPKVWGELGPEFAHGFLPVSADNKVSSLEGEFAVLNLPATLGEDEAIDCRQFFRGLGKRVPDGSEFAEERKTLVIVRLFADASDGVHDGGHWAEPAALHGVKRIGLLLHEAFCRFHHGRIHGHLEHA